MLHTAKESPKIGESLQSGRVLMVGSKFGGGGSLAVMVKLAEVLVVPLEQRVVS